MLKGGVIMDVTTPEQAKIAEAAGACAVMALERIPADIRAAGGVSRMSDPKMIKGIQDAVSIPVMAKCRIGHFVEAQILEAIEIDYIDESEVLSPADDVYHIDKTKFKVPFVCGAKDLGEALRRINEGASMIRTKGEPGTGDVVQAVRHMRMMNSEIAKIKGMREDELFNEAKILQVPYDLVEYVHKNGRLPVVNFAAGGVATPADAALMMQLGAEGVFVGSGIFKSGNPEKRANAIVKAVTNYTDAGLIASLSEDLGEAITLPVTVRRNAYGRQLGSFHVQKEWKGIGVVPMTFIRAPYITNVGEGVEILATENDHIVAVRYENQLAMSFHPELDEDQRIHQYFVEMVQKEK